MIYCDPPWAYEPAFARLARGSHSHLSIAIAAGISRLLTSALVFLRTFDVPSYCGGILLVVAAALAAGYFPSRRAARIDPITTLRYD